MQSLANTSRSKCFHSTKPQPARPYSAAYNSTRSTSAQLLVPGQLPVPSCQAVDHDEYSSASSHRIEQSNPTSQCPPSTSGQQSLPCVSYTSEGHQQLWQQAAVKAGVAMFTIAMSTVLFASSALAGEVAGSASNPIAGKSAACDGIPQVGDFLV